VWAYQLPTEQNVFTNWTIEHNRGIQEANMATKNLSSPKGSPLQRAPSKQLGPEYKPLDERPQATVSTSVKLENVSILSQTPQLIALLT
jgi:hypothetical protein